MINLEVIKSNEIYSIEKIKELVKDIFNKFGIKRAYLFGSYSRGEATEKSDIDIVIEKGRLRTLLELTELENDLNIVLKKDIDIVTEESLKNNKEYRYFYNEICKERIIIYE